MRNGFAGGSFEEEGGDEQELENGEAGASSEGTGRLRQGGRIFGPE